VSREVMFLVLHVSLSALDLPLGVSFVASVVGGSRCRETESEGENQLVCLLYLSRRVVSVTVAAVQTSLNILHISASSSP
jgi:hypothetical protein